MPKPPDQNDGSGESADSLTVLLKSWATDRDALDRLMPLEYRELHRIAQ